MISKLLTPALVLGLSAALACAEPAKTTTTTTKAIVAAAGKKFDAIEGKKIFEANCASCHGVGGHGDGVAAAALKPKPRNLTDKAYMSKRSWEELHKVISEGGANSGFSALMPAWKGALKKPQIDNVLAYVLSFSGNSAKADSAAAKTADKPKAKAKAE